MNMDKQTIDRLLDEGLKQYSRVEPPADFSARLEEKLRAASESPGPMRWWLWLPVPAAVAAALALALIPRPADVAPPPRLVASMPAASLKPNRGATVRERVPRRSIHVLTPTELAAMRLPPQLITKEPPAEVTVPDLSIPDLKITAMDSEDKRSQ
jgi:hypothetical protein